ncbi:MAG: alanine--tRNA ligase [Phycisphaerae bacterium]
MRSQEVRKQFLDFFAAKQHVIVPSTAVVPQDDPTLMFTNAGMNQFKDVFLGTGSRDYRRAADTQKCIRAGGKHNDLDDVGQDTYHHTFFEMLGNWSFGDYFKKEAIAWAWELMTEVWGIDKSRLHATYFEGDEREGLEPDDEAARLWRDVTDIDPTHIHPGNKKDNFWEMGDTGPCGPCSEIHIDLTPDKSGAALVNGDDARVIELWNLVFIQFNRGPNGDLAPLPAKHVDTGMGFERITAVLEGMAQNRLGAVSNYDTDVFTPIFDAIQKRTNAPAYTGTLPTDAEPRAPSTEPRASARADTVADGQHNQIMIDVAYRVVADHIRCLTFALTDGALPGNEGRGYVLRRILRRAVRYGRQYFDLHEPFLCDLVPPLVAHMADAFPELRANHGGKNVEHVAETLRDEEQSFFLTIDRGLKLYREEAELARRSDGGRISGAAAFKLHDTYGFTIDLTQLMADEEGLTIDIPEYERLMEAARRLAQSGGKPARVSATLVASASMKARATLHPGTVDTHKYELNQMTTRFRGCFEPAEGLIVKRLDDPGDQAVVLAETCFYAEQGGQVGDVGTIRADTGWFQVVDTQKIENGVLHIGRLQEGYLEPDCEVAIEVGPARLPTQKNHTATHILNWALRAVLGDHIQQKGSLVDPEKTRFDFSHGKPLSDDEVARIEALCNEQIEFDLRVYTKEVDQAKARAINTLRAVFGEKYPDRVRVVSIGVPIGDEDGNDPHTLLGNPTNPQWMNYSVEFCGGTHLRQTSEAKRFVLIAEEGVAKGVRRVVGVSGQAAVRAAALGEELITQAQALAQSTEPQLGACRDAPAGDSGDAATEKKTALSDRLADLHRRMAESIIPIRAKHELKTILEGLHKTAKAQEKASAAESADAVKDAIAALLASAEVIGDVTIVVGDVPAAPPDALRGAVDWVRNKTAASAVLLATESAGRVTLIAGMSQAVVGQGLRAGDLIKEIAPLVGGKGGGRPDMAQGGGSDPAGIAQVIERAAAWIREKLG